MSNEHWPGDGRKLPAGQLTAFVMLPPPKYAEPRRQVAFFRDINSTRLIATIRISNAGRTSPPTAAANPTPSRPDRDPPNVVPPNYD